MEGGQDGSGWLTWLGLGIGITTLVFSAIGAGGVLLNSWRRRPNLKLSISRYTLGSDSSRMPSLNTRARW